MGRKNIEDKKVCVICRAKGMTAIGSVKNTKGELFDVLKEIGLKQTLKKQKDKKPNMIDDRKNNPNFDGYALVIVDEKKQIVAVLRDETK